MKLPTRASEMDTLKSWRELLLELEHRGVPNCAGSQLFFKILPRVCPSVPTHTDIIHVVLKSRGRVQTPRSSQHARDLETIKFQSLVCDILEIHKRQWMQ